jgi:hypothetical protein
MSVSTATRRFRSLSVDRRRTWRSHSTSELDALREAANAEVAPATASGPAEADPAAPPQPTPTGPEEHLPAAGITNTETASADLTHDQATCTLCEVSLHT